MKNLGRVYQLQNDIAKSVKGEKIFYLYLNHLKSMWNEHLYRPMSTNLEVLKKREKVNWIFEVLAGFGNDFENF